MTPGEEKQISGFLALRTPGEKKARYFRESTAGPFQISFVDFLQERPLQLNMSEIGSPSQVDVHFQTTQPAQQSQQLYVKAVSQAVNTLVAKNWGKVVLSRCQHVSTTKSALQIFEDLCEHYPSAAVYLFSHADAGTWLGASPETLLYYNQYKLETMSLAGTIPRDRSRDFSDKEREEQQIVTDYIFEQLHQESKLSEISVSQPGEQESGPVVHLKTALAATPALDFAPADLLRSLHPTPAVCGFPRKETRQYIKENEGYNREYYTGYFGLRSEKTGKYWVNLRCMQLFEGAGVVYAGGGITAKSDPQSEWEETESKMRTIIDVL